MERGGENLVERLETLYRGIEADRMDAVPILNKALRVAAIGFGPFHEYALGVLVTSWFMNLMLVPQDQAGFASTGPRVGGKRALDLPAGRVEFIVGYEEGLGWILSASLFSPVLEFADQEAAQETARAALSAVLDEEFEPEMDDMRSIWRGGVVPAPEPVPKPLPARLSRRAFLGRKAQESAEQR